MTDLVRPKPAVTDLAALLGRLAAGRDGEAWGLVLERVGEPVWRLALRISGDAALAEDVVQETLLQIRDCAGNFRARSADPDLHAHHWIMRIAGTTCIDLVRRQHHQRQRDVRAGARQESPAMTDQAPGAELERRELAASLRRAVAALPARFRHAVTLYFFAGHDYDTVALQLGIPVGTAKSHVHRGLERLRSDLGHEGRALSGVAVIGLLDNLAAALPPALPPPLLGMQALLRSPLTASLPKVAATGLAAKAAFLAVAAALAAAVGLAAVAGQDHPHAPPAAAPWHPADGLLVTRWAKEVSPDNALPEYPRPTQVRERWQNLNGLWDYAVTGTDAAAPNTWDGRILVPFPYESALSGVGKPSIPRQRLWYRRSFTVPGEWAGQRVLLNFGAVDWEAAVTVNGVAVGAHTGCYTGFSLDITDALHPGANELVVAASNPIEQVGDQVRGKQRLKSEGMMYRASTGIWQTVWLEPVPTRHIAHLQIIPDLARGAVRVRADITGGAADAAAEPLTVAVSDGGAEVARASAPSSGEVVVPIASPHLWSTTDPHLYDLRITLGTAHADHVDSYVGMRSVGIGKNAQGQSQIFINGRFEFEIGALDQGYWPDGIYTAPTDAARRYDLEQAKRLHFNLLRKHAKVEPERWYYWADRLGMLVWQDMPQGFPEAGRWSDAGKARFEREWREELIERRNHPSIIVWVPFNEGWGQHDTEHVVAVTRELDPTRLVNEGSGWDDKGYGDINDMHPYPGPASVVADKTRAFPHQALANGEMGGLAIRWPSHTWKDGPGIGWFTDPAAITDRYQHLIAHAYQLQRSEGLSAVVYTQLTDVEFELNGVMTYDREVFKFDPDAVAAANQGHFPAWAPELVPTSLDEGQEWRYTTVKPADGWNLPGFDDSAWKTGKGTFGLISRRSEWKGKPSEPDLWIRRTVTLPTDIPADLDLLLLYDEDPEVFLNGVLAGSAKGSSINYERIPVAAAARAALVPGANVIAAHARDTGGACGLDVGVTVRKGK